MNDNERRVIERLGCDPDELEIDIDLDVEIDLNFDPEEKLILRLLGAINRKVNILMADLTALNAAVDSLTAAESAAAVELAELRDEVAQLTAGEISQEQIDSITNRVTGVAEALNAAAADPAPPAPVDGAPPEGGEVPPAGEPPVGETPPADAPPAEGTPPEGETPAEGAPPA